MLKEIEGMKDFLAKYFSYTTKAMSERPPMTSTEMTVADPQPLY